MYFHLIKLAIFILCSFIFVNGQRIPELEGYFGDEMMFVTLPGDAGSSKSFTCRSTIEAFQFRGLYGPDNNLITQGGRIISSHTVPLSYSRGNYASMKRLRDERLGAYHCVYAMGPIYRAYAFIISEMPAPGTIRSGNIKEIGTAPGENELRLHCTVPNTADVIWEKFIDRSGIFEIFREVQSVTLSYNELAHGHGDGFTIYRCYSRRDPETVQYIHATYSKSLLNRPVRTSNYSTTTLPYYIRYDSRISLECHGNGTLVSNANPPSWYFKHKDSDRFIVVTESDPKFRGNLQASGTFTTLVIPNMRNEYDGIYRCRKDLLSHYVKVKLTYGDVEIVDYSKSTYELKQTGNYITCRLPEVSLKQNSFWRLKRRGQSPLIIRPQQTVEGLRADYDARGNLILQFDQRADLIGSRLECEFFGSVDYTDLKKILPKLTLKDTTSADTYFYVTCEKDTTFGAKKDLEVYVLNNDGSLGDKLTSYGTNIKSQNNYMTKKANHKSFARLQCQVKFEGQLLKSNVLMFGTPPVSVDIIVEGDVNPDRKVFLSGRNVPVFCKFPYLMGYQTEANKMDLLKDGVRVTTAVRQQMNDTTWQFMLQRPTSRDTGNYRCRYNPADVKRTKRAVSNPVPLEVKSKNVHISFCTTSQFVCDNVCKDNTLMCDKKRDCADGYDERPEYCDKCEPNSVKCQVYNGAMPAQRCVLKHWLCDGQDDCGNNWDEDVGIHRKWCYKDNSCSGCKPHETCCPNSNKCIWRSYECDKENDCSGTGSPLNDETGCSPAVCLTLEQPTSRQTITLRVGEPMTLTCVANGMDRPTITWRRNWGPIPKQLEENNMVLMRDPTNSNYRVQGQLTGRVTKDMAGIYNCEAVNNCKRELSLEFTLKVVD